MNIIEQDISCSFIPIGKVHRISSSSDCLETFIDECIAEDSWVKSIKEIKRQEEKLFLAELQGIKKSLEISKQDSSWISQLDYEEFFEVIEDKTYSSGSIWILKKGNDLLYINWHRES